MSSRICRRRHFFVCPVSDNFALLAVFDNNVAVGVVRLNAHRAAETILNSLQEVVKSRTGYGQADPAAVSNATVAAAADSPFLKYN